LGVHPVPPVLGDVNTRFGRHHPLAIRSVPVRKVGTGSSPDRRYSTTVEPLVGRDVPLAAADAAITGAARGAGTLVLVSGDAASARAGWSKRSRSGPCAWILRKRPDWFLQKRVG
jgi:hypothetical protein